MIIPSRVEPDNFKFPTVTVCQNSLHDSDKIQAHAPFMTHMIGTDVDKVHLTTIVGLLYNTMLISNETVEIMESCKLHNATEDEIKEVVLGRNHTQYHLGSYLDILKNHRSLIDVDYRRLFELTSPNYTIKACRFDTQDCRQQWREVITQDGRCLVLKEHDLGRKLSVIIEYDPLKWSAGWRHFMDGFTVYYSKPSEINIEARSSFQVSRVDNVFGL